MSIRQYTAAQLLALRESPLVVKPENLPAIEQWIEYVYLERADGVREKLRIPHSESAASQQPAQQPQQKKRPAVGGEASPMGSFSTGRPTLPTRTSALRGNGEDVSLGPPKTMFPSSRNASRLSEVTDRNATPAGDAASGEDADSTRSRFFSDRQMNRKSMNSEKEAKDARDNRDSWTSVRERREKQDREDSDRRNGFGERSDPRWSRDERRNGDRAGGWREREQQRRERENDRAEKEPEWMDDPVLKKDQELGFGVARTQEDFQKWKEGMSKKTKGEAGKEVEGPQSQTQAESAPAPAPQAAPEPKPVVAPLKLDGFEDGMFGGWGAASASVSSQGASTPGATSTSKSAAAKGKTSRFASMFKPAAEEMAATPAEEPQSANGQIKQTTAEDQEGFNRLLQMLGAANVKAAQPQSLPEQTPASPQPQNQTAGTNGTAAAKPKSRFMDMFSQRSPERLQSPQQGGVQLGDSMFGGELTDAANVPGGRPAADRTVVEHPIPQPQSAPGGLHDPSGIPFNALREQQPRPASGRVNDIAMFDPPSRGAASPDVNIQNLLAQNRQRHQGQNSESQQLLNLLRKDTSNSRPASQQAQPANAGMDQAQLHHWLENQQRPPQMSAEPHAPKPRVPQQPPGLFEEQLMRNYHSEQQQRAEQPSLPPGVQDQRRSAQRAPPGFFSEQSIFLQQQQQQQQQLRRQFVEGLPPQAQQPQMPGAGRRPSGHPNLPPMQISQNPQFPPQLDFHQMTSPAGVQGPPPPGFNRQMPRHPPGFHNVNIFQQQQPPQPREPPPPGFAQSPPGNAPPPGFFNGPQGMPPPGFQQLRSPVDGLPPGAGRGRGYVDGFPHDPSIAMGGPRR